MGHFQTDGAVGVLFRVFECRASASNDDEWKNGDVFGEGDSKSKAQPWRSDDLQREGEPG